MNIALLLIPLGVILMAVAAAALFWAVDAGQFDDLDAPARAILEEEAADASPAGRGPRAGALPTRRRTRTLARER